LLLVIIADIAEACDNTARILLHCAGMLLPRVRLLLMLLCTPYIQLSTLCIQTDKRRTPADSAACIEATVQAVKAARAREREKLKREEAAKKQVRVFKL
jgi:hypothetical protein